LFINRNFHYNLIEKFYLIWFTESSAHCIYLFIAPAAVKSQRAVLVVVVAIVIAFNLWRMRGGGANGRRGVAKKKLKSSRRRRSSCSA